MMQMFEVEIKAVVTDLEGLIQKIEALGPESGGQMRYEDVYFDKGDALTRADKELRIRKVTDGQTGTTTAFLTYKDPPFHQGTKSKPELETTIANFETGLQILRKLGFEVFLQFEKNCRLYDHEYKGRHLQITLAEIPELNQTFIEVESQTSNKAETEALFKVLNSFLKQLGVSKKEHTATYYTQAIKKARTIQTPSK